MNTSGGILVEILKYPSSTDCTPPFLIDVFTDSLADNGTQAGPNTAQSQGTHNHIAQN